MQSCGGVLKKLAMQKIIFGNCNNNCWSCSYKSRNVSDKITSEIEKLDSSKPVLIAGEPTIHPDFFKTLKKLYDFPIVRILTNARALAYSDYAKKLSEFPNIEVLVKILGHNENIHDSLTCEDGSLRQTVNGIRNLISLNIKVSAVIEILEQNFVFIERLIDQLIHFGVREILISSPKPNNPNYSKVTAPFHELKSTMMRIARKPDCNIFFEDIPLCFLGEFKDRALMFGFNVQEKYDSEKCLDCLNKDICPKIYKDYYDIFTDEFLESEPDQPREVAIEITTACNLDCTFCFKKNIYKKGEKRELDLESIKTIISKIPKGVERIRITGGEPLLHKEFFKILKHIRTTGHKIWLNTNATLVNDENAEEISKYVENVLVPLHGFDEKSEKEITGENSLAKKIDGIKKLQKHGIRTVRSGTVASKCNIQNLEKIFTLVLRLRLSDWELYRPIPVPGSGDPIDNDDVGRLINKLTLLNKRYNKSYRIVNSLPFCSVDDMWAADSVCRGAIADDGHMRLVIGSDFIIRPSYFMDEKIGDIRNCSVEDAWNKKLMKSIRNLKLVPIQCMDCIYLMKCKGGSRSAAKIVNGSYESRDPLMM